MKTAPIVAALLVHESGVASATNPVNKVVQMLSDLQAKVISEGKAAQKVYEEYSEWCEERSRTLGFEIKTGGEEAASLKATIAKETADSAALTTRIEELTAELAQDESDLTAAVTIRGKEAGVFAATEKDLVETTDMLERAIRIIEREMAKGGASMLQVQNAGNLVQVLSAMVDASAIASADASKLTAFIQNSESNSDDDVGAPAGSVYDSHSSNIQDTLNSLLEKAQSQLSDARNTETSNQHAFDRMRQGLEDEVSYGKKELDEAKKGLAGSSGDKATAEGDLGATSKELAADVSAKADLHHECMTTAENFEAEMKSRGEELKALAEAKKALVENTGAAEGISYNFLQESSHSAIASSSGLANFEAVRLVSDLARKEKSAALAQLAQRMRVAMHSSDPFGKVKGLIRDMLDKLEAEAEADASKKMWCDRNLADANQRKADKTAEIKKLSTRIDSKSARSAQLKEEIAELENSLAKLAASQVSMNKIRSEEKQIFLSNKADMEQGLEGVKLALKILGEYYATQDKAHSAAMGAGEGIIGLLEVVESDFSKQLAEITATEDAAVAAYEEQTKENEIEKTTKDQDVAYKTKESKHLDKETSELSSDRRTVQAELDATNKLLTQLDTQCIDKAETYAEQKARREAELAGLREALQILENETALVQKRSLRATRRHA
jgi:hypothetical protein